MAEGVGFEPTDPYGSPVFKTGALNRSAIPPIRYCTGSPAGFALATLGSIFRVANCCQFLNTMRT
jgi:hypothetical protein